MKHTYTSVGRQEQFPIHASGLCKRVSPRKGETITLLDNVEFTAPWGAMTGIVGPSGSGKSTLLYCLAGLEPVSSGQVDILGQRVSSMGPAASARFRREHLGFVFQAYNLVPSMSVEDNLKLPFTLRNARWPQSRVSGVLTRLGIDGLVKTNVTLLSGGEQQRVALARTLLSDPDVIFADEPTGALDRDTGNRVVDELAAFANHPGHAVVMVTHSAQVASRCDTVVRLSDGRIATADRDSILRAGV
ncbi:ABC transporter [Bifidobacterium lemurum]|uniref:ABC transporter n=1 Tax=Bifidobacterium lemurum TaxID=1603886 RepID=A0A261FLH3_9BIFI|nr:ABC transporter ATP-binding protein [Bifidobacterium lemurum]OZG59948.1 ABC transporter [Bifidobacterium lemurum]QOL33966.1 ABC transporter ATP-binding protein [Bifidobacterium lemurum]